MKNALFGLARFLLTPIAFLGLRIFKPTKVNFYLKSGQVVIIRCDDYKFTYGKNGEITHYNVKGCFPDAVIPVTEIAAVTLEG